MTAAVVLARMGCTNRAYMAALIGVTADTGTGTVVVPDVMPAAAISVSGLIQHRSVRQEILSARACAGRSVVTLDGGRKDRLLGDVLIAPGVVQVGVSASIE